MKLCMLMAGCIILLASACRQTMEKGTSMNGVCLVAPRHPLQPESLLSLQELQANWVAVVPYAFARAGQPQVIYHVTKQWWGESRTGVIQTIARTQQMGLKVMLKPHVWVSGQGWPGDFTLETEEAWQQWEQAYSDYLLTMAHIADSMQVELLCIGTEYRLAVQQRPAFWHALIDSIRTTYAGQLTYAANWDDFAEVDFWDQLDFIGIDAYFPLDEAQTPAVASLKEAWQTPLAAIRKVHKRFGKPVLFTEYGYQSVDYAARGHWHMATEELQVNEEAQQQAYEALYQMFWQEPWFAGGFVWKWYADHEIDPREHPIDYSPQGKLAEETIRQVYGR